VEVFERVAHAAVELAPALFDEPPVGHFLDEAVPEAVLG
jgi:hypothetical protein